MHCFLLKFTFCPCVFEFLLGTSKTLRRSMSPPQVKIVPLPDALQLFAGTLTYLEPKPFSLVIF
jgi:hypothetical protein